MAAIARMIRLYGLKRLALAILLEDLDQLSAGLSYSAVLNKIPASH
jgi:hypothetical protein